LAKLCEKRHPLRQAGYRRLPKVRIFQQGAGRRGAAAVRAGDASARFRTVRCAAGCVRHISTKWPSSGPASFALGIAGLTPGASPGVATRHAGCVRHISAKWPSSRLASFARLKSRLKTGCGHDCPPSSQPRWRTTPFMFRSMLIWCPSPYGTPMGLMVSPA